jgi:uncharacterized Zn-finger protein
VVVTWYVDASSRVLVQVLLVSSTCDACGKDFDREDARNRHMKTHLKDSTASGQTYSCGVCGKEFSRADTRTRHEAAHSYSLRKIEDGINHGFI